MEYLRLVKDDDEWVLPTDSWIDSVPASVRADTQERAFQHGSVKTGSGKIEERIVALSILATAGSQAEYLALSGEIKRKLYRENQRLYIAPDRYINLAVMDSLEEKFDKGFLLRQAVIRAEFKCTDPFWYSTPVEATVAPTGTPRAFTLANGGNVDTAPVITVTAPASGTVPEVRITNAANGRESVFRDPRLANGAAVTIDGVAGTVTLDGDNAVNAFYGAFPRLEPGDNAMTYTGAKCSIAITYDQRWL